MQLTQLFDELDNLHSIYGDKEFTPIYGAGQIIKPRICLVFMNPTARNVSSHKSWKGLRAPWIGTKSIWKMFYRLGLFKDEDLIQEIIRMKVNDWTESFAEQVYMHIKSQSIYITNIAKCTQPDARHLSNEVYKAYLDIMYRELSTLKPKYIFTFGNQVSSVLLNKKISVSNYLDDEFETISLTNKSLKIYPTYYPVGQGTRNMPKAIDRVSTVINSV